MKKTILYFSILLLVACNNNTGPDVSGVKVEVTFSRFDRDFFALDTNNIAAGMDQLEQKYPYFLRDFVQFIVLANTTDTIRDAAVQSRKYLAMSKPLYDSIKDRFTNIEDLQGEFKKGFQHVRYYYPAYAVPRIVTYSGLIGDPSIALTKEAMIIGLQMFAGSNFGPYNTVEAQQVYPYYISRRFEPEYIVPSAFTNVATDIYPDQTQGKAFVEQMIEKGKQWYLLNKFLPDTHDSLKTGYTGAQLEWCRENEGQIWNALLQTDLYSTDAMLIQNYIGESPKTQGMPDQSPGNIGQWIGWRIVETYAKNNPGLKPQKILSASASTILKESKYKPR